MNQLGWMTDATWLAKWEMALFPTLYLEWNYAVPVFRWMLQRIKGLCWILLLEPLAQEMLWMASCEAKESVTIATDYVDTDYTDLFSSAQPLCDRLTNMTAAGRREL